MIDPAQRGIGAAGWRRWTVREGLRRAESEMGRAGVTRLTQLTGLDRLGIPCWQASRPTAMEENGTITVFNGCGRDSHDARLRALMEALERYWAEGSAVALEVARTSELRSSGREIADPEAIPLPLGTDPLGDAPLAWVAGQALDGRCVMLPAHEVLCPFVPPEGASNPPLWRSVGLAAGSSFREAAFFALLEVIERDATAIAELAKSGVSVDPDRVSSTWFTSIRERLAASGIHLELKELPALAQLPVYAACLDDRLAADAMLLVSGFGAHLDPVLAVERALMEAVQTRMVVIAGAREDLDQFSLHRSIGYGRARAELRWWFDPAPGEPSHEIREVPPPEGVDDVLAELVARLSSDGYEPIFCMLTPPDAAITVVRVVVPGTTHIAGQSIRLGRRVRVTSGA